MFWRNKDELARYVSVSLSGEFNNNPQIGWIRTDLAAIKRDDSISLGIKSAFDWLYSHSNIIRTNQSFEFTLEEASCKDNPAIKINGRHRYTINNPNANKSLYVHTKLITELGLQSVVPGGFSRVIITMDNDKKVFDDELLKPYIIYDTSNLSKTSFTYDEDIPPGKSVTFEFHTFGVFRLCDRFVWYSQDFCEDCEIKVINNVDNSRPIRYRINHHEKDRIEHGKIKHIPKAKQDIITFGFPIYPYEGFAMFWDFAIG